MLADDLLSPSHRAVGQVVEWLVWAAVVGNSESITHVFLPLDDRGVDGIVRRVEDEAMCAVQVKGRSATRHGALTVVVRRAALDDPNVTFVLAVLDTDTVTLGDPVYVVDAATVLALGVASSGANGPVIELNLPYPAHAGSRWTPFACAVKDLPARLLPPLPRPPTHSGSSPRPTAPRPEPLIPEPPRQRELLGHIAELEVMRLLGEPPTLNTFKSFPDLEEAEYLVRHRPSGNIRGIQVKCLIVPDVTTSGTVDFHGPSFVPSPLTDVVILAWRHDLGGFDDSAWVIPAIDLPQLVSTQRNTIELHLRLSSTNTRFDRYHVPRAEVAALIDTRAARSRTGDPPTGALDSVEGPPLTRRTR